MPKKRVDALLYERGLAESRSQAQRLIMAGQVRADGQLVHKPATQVSTTAELLVDQGPRFVSRGGDKLAAGLEAFSIDPAGWTCADVGASTGGFTDCLLQAGADKVFAVEVGQGILHWKIRQDKRVQVLEGTNVRYLTELEMPVQLVTVDVSFISLKYVLPVISGWFGPDGGQVIALIKPQFEAGKVEVDRGKGVIKDPKIHRQILQEVLLAAQALDFEPRGLIASPILGPKGNREFLAWLVYPAQNGIPNADLIAGLFSEE